MPYFPTEELLNLKMQLSRVEKSGIPLVAGKYVSPMIKTSKLYLGI